LEGAVRVSPAGSGFQLTSSFVLQQGETPLALVETRKIALDELHYLDHPLVGLLIQVTALQQTTEADEPSLPAVTSSPSARDEAD
jgi:hypothetical protein